MDGTCAPKKQDAHRAPDRGRKWKLRTLVAIVSTVAIVVFTSALVHSYLQRRELQPSLEHHDVPVSGSLTDVQCEEEFCTTKGCITAAGRMADMMNTEVNPCEDFYEYICGNYQRGRSPSLQHDYNSEKEADENLIQALKRTLDTPPRDGDSDSLKKSRILFSSCTNTERRDKASLGDFVQFLNDIHLQWPVLSTDWQDDGTDWKLIVRKLANDYGIHTLFLTTTGNRYRQLDLVCKVPTLPVEAYLYHNESDKPFIMEMYTKVLDFGLKSLSIDLDKRKEFVTEIINLETEIARSLAESSEESTVQPSRDFIEMIVENAERVDELVGHVHPKCSGNLNKILDVLQSQTHKLVKDYLGWRTFFSVMRFLSTELKELSDYIASFPDSPPVYSTRLMECASDVRDEMGLMATKAFMDAGHFTQQQEDQIKGILTEVKEDVATAWRSLPWMDNVTLNAFIDKVKNTKLNLGYPEDLRNNNALDHLVQELEVNENHTYFRNLMKVRKRLASLNDGGYRDHSDRRNPLRTNAVFVYVNEIDYQLGFVHPPMMEFGEDYPKYLKYGYAIHLSHDMGHCFDSTGAQFNAQGERVGIDWWPDVVKEKYLGFVECLKRQEAERSGIDVTKIDMERIDEQIAELGAFFITHTGLSEHLRLHGEDEKPLPGVNLNKEQTYLVQASQVHCNLQDPSSSNHQYAATFETGKRRLHAAITNFEYFGDIFNCPVGSPMNPAQKCNLLR